MECTRNLRRWTSRAHPMIGCVPSENDSSMILPLVTPLGLHGVSPRARTSRPRYHLHVVGEISDMLFDMPRALK